MKRFAQETYFLAFIVGGGVVYAMDSLWRWPLFAALSVLGFVLVRVGFEKKD